MIWILDSWILISKLRPLRLRFHAPSRSRRIVVARAAVDLVREAGAVPFCNLAGEIRIRRPQQEGSVRVILDWPLQSRRTAAWIQNLLFEAGRDPLGPRELTQVMQILDGMAIDNETELELPDAIEGDPILSSLILFVFSQEGWRGSATQLQGKLQQVAERMELMHPQDARWPKTASHFAMHLNSLDKWLAESGITHTYHHSEFMREHILSITANAQLASSNNGQSKDRAAEDQIDENAGSSNPANEAFPTSSKRTLRSCPIQMILTRMTPLTSPYR